MARKKKVTADSSQDLNLVLDSFTNVVKGLGVKGVDASKSTGVGAPRVLTDVELTYLYSGDGLASRIINLIPQDMVRNGWEVPADNDGKLYNAQQRLQVKTHLADAMRWSRLYGGSVVVMEFENGGSLTTPIEPYKSKAKLIRLRVYPRTRVVVDKQSLNTNMKSPYYGDYEKLLITNGRTGTQFSIHISRCLVFRGISAPDTQYRATSYEDGDFWGIPELQVIWDHLSSLGSNLQLAGLLVSEANVGKIKLKDFDLIMAENDTNALLRRLTNMAMAKGIINALVLGEGDEYTRDSINFAGLPEMIDRLFMVLSGISGIPVTKLFGRSAAGQNATGEEDSRNYYDDIESKQELDLLPNLIRLLQFIDGGMEKPIGEESLAIEFNPVWAPSELQYVEMKARQASADQIYLQAGVVSPEEVRRMRFSGGYAFEQALPENTIGDLPAVPPVVNSAQPALKENTGTPGRKRNEPKAGLAPLPNKTRKK